jgi:hypothetical protein
LAKAACRVQTISVDHSNGNLELAQMTRPLPDHGFENPSETQELIQLRGFLDISARAEGHHSLSIGGSVGRAQNHNRNGVARLAIPNGFENFASGAFGQVEVKDDEVRTVTRLGIEISNIAYSSLSVHEYCKLAANAMFL